MKSDEIIIAACPVQNMPALHGKFVSKVKGGKEIFCFCPFKKGLSFDFLPADQWHHADSKEAAISVAEALKSSRAG